MKYYSLLWNILGEKMPGLITLQSWNPDKETYPDFTVSLDDVEQIFNVVDPFNKLL